MKKNIMITGASRGIGRCLATGLAACGHQIALIARHHSELEKTVNEITRQGNAAVCSFILDVQHESACAKVVESLLEQWEHIDLLINCAGIFEQGSWEKDSHILEQLLQVNVIGTFNMAKQVIPHMIKRKQGQLINFGSRRGKMAHPKEALYSISKYAVTGLNEALYKELAPKGIKVTAICPGWVYTDMAKTSPIKPQQMISTEDMLSTVKYLMELSSAACIKEILLEPKGDIV